jgi:hypothetical protein
MKNLKQCQYEDILKVFCYSLKFNLNEMKFLLYLPFNVQIMRGWIGRLEISIHPTKNVGYLNSPQSDGQRQQHACDI